MDVLGENRAHRTYPLFVFFRVFQVRTQYQACTAIRTGILDRLDTVIMLLIVNSRQKVMISRKVAPRRVCQ